MSILFGISAHEIHCSVDFGIIQTVDPNVSHFADVE